MSNILPNFKKAIKEKGYTSAEKFAEEYDKKYPHYKKDSQAESKSSFRKLQNGIGNPNITTVVNVCDLLDCDVDYLLDRIDQPTHEDKFIHEHTGLSETAIKNIKGLSKEETSALNLLLESPQFCKYFLWELYYYKNTNENIHDLESVTKSMWEKHPSADNPMSETQAKKYNEYCDSLNEKREEIRSCKLDLYERSVRVLDQIDEKENLSDK